MTNFCDFNFCYINYLLWLIIFSVFAASFLNAAYFVYVYVFFVRWAVKATMYFIEAVCLTFLTVLEACRRKLQQQHSHTFSFSYKHRNETQTGKDGLCNVCTVCHSLSVLGTFFFNMSLQCHYDFKWNANTYSLWIFETLFLLLYQCTSTSCVFLFSLFFRQWVDTHTFVICKGFM